jgi:hypothetical protein
MEEFSFAMGFVVFPFSFISSAIRPDLNSKAVSHIPNPLAFIYSAAAECERGSSFSLAAI